MTKTVRVFFAAFSYVSVAFYAALFWSILAGGELFHRLGFDWTMFYAQSMALRTDGGRWMYELAEMNRYLPHLASYYSGGGLFQTAQPVPYPPWFAAALLPFTLPPPPVGFALWEGTSLLAAIYLAYRVRQFVPQLGPVATTAAVLAAIPVATSLYMGQVAVLLAVAVGEMLISFKAGREFRAGLWLAVLLVKPQYALLFGLLIVFKMRRQALAGLAVGGLIFLLFGVVVAGLPAFLGLPSALGQMSEFRGLIGGPWWMMNWRAIVLAARPGIGDLTGYTLVSSLSLLTMAVSLLHFRGPWNPDAPSFGPRFCLLTLGALISSFHSHLHGAALLVVPLAAAWAVPIYQPLTRAVVCAAVYLPTLLLMGVAGIGRRMAVSADADLPLWYVWPEALPAVLFALAFGLMNADLLTSRGDLAQLKGYAAGLAAHPPASLRALFSPKFRA